MCNIGCCLLFSHKKSWCGATATATTTTTDNGCCLSAPSQILTVRDKGKKKTKHIY